MRLDPLPTVLALGVTLSCSGGRDGLAQSASVQDAQASATKSADDAVAQAWARARGLRGVDDAARVLHFVESLNSGALRTLEGAADPLLGWRDVQSNEEFRQNAMDLFELAQAERRIRIVGGDETHEFPDCVAVGSSSRWCCTGTLVARNVVVTAAHCLASCGSRVFIGADVSGTGATVGVSRSERHPDADLAVLILSQDLAVPPRAMQVETSTTVPGWVRIVGFGNTDTGGTTGYGKKRRVDVPVKTWSCGGTGEPELYGCIQQTEFVAAPPALGDPKDSCTGDSGGPAYAWVGGSWILCGAVSRATSNSTRVCGDGGIYVKIQNHERWIRSVAGGHW